MNKRIIIFTGQTATGKTKKAIEFAKEKNGEIICMDSMQVYKFMPILSACPTEKEKKEVPHHLFEIVSPLENFSVALYSKLAKSKIEEVISRGKLPILAGGTGLYMNSLLYLDLENVPYDSKIREELEQKTNEELYSELQKKDVENKTHENDRKRLIRALEIYRITGKTKTEWDAKNRVASEYIAEIYAKKMERDELYELINKRSKEILSSGAVEEVENLIEIGVTENHTAGKAIGFSEIKEYITGEINYDTCLEKLSQSTRNYAKRQDTWFRANREINWI